METVDTGHLLSYWKKGTVKNDFNNAIKERHKARSSRCTIWVTDWHCSNGCGTDTLGSLLKSLQSHPAELCGMVWEWSNAVWVMSGNNHLLWMVEVGGSQMNDSCSLLLQFYSEWTGKPVLFVLHKREAYSEVKNHKLLIINNAHACRHIKL